MTSDEIAAFTRPHQLSVKIAMDGTRRHYLLHHPTEDGQVPDLMDYSTHCTGYFVRICEMLFSFGVHTVMALNLWPPDVHRRENDFLRLTLKMSEVSLLHPRLLALAEKWKVALRLYGDYDIVPEAEPIREGLVELHNKLTELTPGPDHLILFGFYTTLFENGTILRTLDLYRKLGRAPTMDELRIACFPDGPEKLDIYIGGGWFRTDSASLPPLLNQGTDLYNLNYLALDLEETTTRKILYDCLFVRRAASLTDNLAYTTPVLQKLSAYYAEHRTCFVGMGELVGPDLWYPEHLHPLNIE